MVEYFFSITFTRFPEIGFDRGQVIEVNYFLL